MNQLPPHDLSAERATLGAMLQDAGTIDAVRISLTEQDFYQHAHQVLYRSILRTRDRLPAASIDLVTLSQDLAGNGLKDVGGYGYLATVHADCPAASNAPHYARIVKQHSIRRQLLQAANEMIRDALDPADPDTLLEEAEKRILAIREKRELSVRLLRDYVHDVQDRCDNVIQGRQAGIATGFADLDQLVLLKPEDLVIIAARPSVGKTSLGAQIALNICLDTLKPALFCSVEMPGIDIAGRVLSVVGGIDSGVTTGRRPPTQEEAEQLADAAATLGPLQFWIDDSSEQTVQVIAANARRLHRQQALGVIVVDYLQLIHVERQKGQTRSEVLGEVSRSLKRLARELKVPVLALAQLNRDADGEPELHHIRESGDIEQDADQVWMPWKPPDERHSGLIYLKIAKQRNGPTGTIKLFHRREFMRFDHYLAGQAPLLPS